MIIKLYDDETDYNYPIIRIKDDNFNAFNDFLQLLEKYKVDFEEDYNIDDFIELLKKQDYFIEIVTIDEEVYF